MRFYLILVIALALPLSSMAAKSYKFIGEARNRKGVLVYTENHEATSDDQGFITQLKTDYKKADGTTIVKMESDFSSNTLVPTIQFEDVRFNRKEKLTLSGDKAKVEITQKNKDETKEFKLLNNMVAGTGFHNFILKNFDALKAKEQIPLYFIVLAKADYFSFGLVQKEIKDGKLTLVLKISSWVLRNFIDPIKVVYDIEKKQLLSFDGLTNIETDQEKTQELVITYKY